MCVNLINWFLEVKDPIDIQLEDERLRIDKNHWSNESKELVRPEPIRRPQEEEENIPIKRAKTEIDIKKDDKKDNIKNQVQFQFQNEEKPKEADRIAIAKE